MLIVRPPGTLTVTYELRADKPVVAEEERSCSVLRKITRLVQSVLKW